MEKTCKFETCTFGKAFFKEPQECFNYKATWWQPLDGPPVMVEDCAPVRTMLMVQDLSNRMVGVQKSQEQMRNEAQCLGGMTRDLRRIALNYEIEA